MAVPRVMIRLHRVVSSESYLDDPMNLRLLQLGDSALPIGGYTHSWGLEAAVDRGGSSTTPPTLEQWTRDWLRHSLGPLEGVLVGAAWRAGGADDWPTFAARREILTASLAPPTIRRASLQMGEQLPRWARPGAGAAAASARFEREVRAGDTGTTPSSSACSAALAGADERAGARILSAPGRPGHDRRRRAERPGRPHARPADPRRTCTTNRRGSPAELVGRDVGDGRGRLPVLRGALR